MYIVNIHNEGKGVLIDRMKVVRFENCHNEAKEGLA